MTPDLLLILMGIALIAVAVLPTLGRLLAASLAAERVAAAYTPATRPTWLGVDQQGRWVGGPVATRTLKWRVFWNTLRSGRP